MGTSAVPALIDAVIAGARAALPNIRVYDGAGNSDDPGDFLMVGVEDPTSHGGEAASSSQVPGPFGTNRPRDENGILWCAAYSWNGDGDQKQARDNVYAYMAAIENLLRTTPNLGIAAGGMFVAQMGDTQRFLQGPIPQGVEAALIFNLAFFARI